MRGVEKKQDGFIFRCIVLSPESSSHGIDREDPGGDDTKSRLPDNVGGEVRTTFRSFSIKNIISNFQLKALFLNRLLA